MSFHLLDFLPYRLNRLSESVSRDFQRIYGAHEGLNRPQWRVLATLAELGTATATDIGRHSSMHKTKVSRAVAALDARRWLRRADDAADRRLAHLTLTAAGLAAHDRIAPLMAAHEAALLARLSQSDRAALMRGLAALEKAAKIDP